MSSLERPLGITAYRDNQKFVGISAAAVPLSAQGVSGQTADLFDVLDSTGTKMFSVDASGNLTIAGSISAVVDEVLTGSISLSGTFTVTGAATMNGNVTLGDAATDQVIIKGNVVAEYNLTVWNQLTINGQTLFGSGSAAIPSISFSADENTGLYRSAVDTLGFTANGTSLATWTNGLLSLNAGDVSWSAGVAVTAARYSVSRDADATNQLHFNVPTGASYEWSINNTAKLVLNSSGYLGLGVVPTHFFHEVAGTLTDTKSALYVSATQPTTITGSQYGVDFQITGAGSSSQLNAAMNIDYNSGYTGNRASAVLRFVNANAGTGTEYLSQALSFTGNCGGFGFSAATTAGSNVGFHGNAYGGNINIACVGQANTLKNGAVNIGVLGLGRNTGSTPTQVGVYAGLNATDPTFTSAALLCDNSDQTSPIAIFRDNGTAVLTIGDASLITLADAVNIVLNATTGTKFGTATTQKLAFYNSAPLAQQASIATPTSDTVGTKAAIDSIITSLELLGFIAAN